jgi:hypothetical protein
MARVLYVLQSYPEQSETYIEVERRQVAERADTFALAVVAPGTFNPDHLPYARLMPRLPKRVQYHLALGLKGAAKAWRPDVVHTHWLMVARLARAAARTCDVPWTVRTHSFDLLEYGPETIARQVRQCNEPDCAGVLAFPFARELLLRAGLKEEKLIDAPPVIDVARFDDLGPNGSGVISMGATKLKKNFPAFLELSRRVPQREFSLYPLARGWQQLRALNETMGARVTVHDPVLHRDMPAVWKRHAWLVYTGTRDHASLGWPIAVCEAWAAGVGVCLQRVRDDLEDYLGGCGILFEHIDELPAVLERDPPEELRRRANERARQFDIRRHMHLLYDAWRGAGVSV